MQLVGKAEKENAPPVKPPADSVNTFARFPGNSPQATSADGRSGSRVTTHR